MVRGRVNDVDLIETPAGLWPASYLVEHPVIY